MSLVPIKYEEAIRIIKQECHEPELPWMRNAQWFLFPIDAEEFQRLLIYYNGPSNVGWQSLTENHSSEIGDIARVLYDYSGTDPNLKKDRETVASLEQGSDFDKLQFTFCLCRVGREGRITLFETNHRALAVYWHCFLLLKGSFPAARGVIAEVAYKQPFQFQ